MSEQHNGHWIINFNIPYEGRLAIYVNSRVTEIYRLGDGTFSLVDDSRTISYGCPPRKLPNLLKEEGLPALPEYVTQLINGQLVLPLI